MNFSVNKKLVISLVLIHALIITLSNFLVQFPYTFLNFNFTLGTFTYPLIILVTDLTVRLSNIRNARFIVGIAFIPAFITSYLLADIRIAIASTIAYLISQLTDIKIFSKIKETLGYKKNEIHKMWYLAPAISTFFSQIIDTYVFYGIAFYNATNMFMAQNWLNIATNDLIFKVGINLILFLPIYGLILNFIIKRFINKN